MCLHFVIIKGDSEEHTFECHRVTREINTEDGKFYTAFIEKSKTYAWKDGKTSIKSVYVAFKINFNALMHFKVKQYI